MKEKEAIEKIKNTIRGIQPFIISDGGNIEFIKYEDNIVYVSMQGPCHSCPYKDMTLNGVVERIIMEEVPEVKQVIDISSTNE